MKGPYERLKYDLRRLWECPVCHRRERTHFSQTFLICQCRKEADGGPIAMRLNEDGVRRVWGTPPQPRPLIPVAIPESVAIAVSEERAPESHQPVAPSQAEPSLPDEPQQHPSAESDAAENE